MRIHSLGSACLAAAGLLFAAPVPKAMAQDANRDVVVSVSNVGDIVDRLGKRTGDFKEDFDKAVEHSMMDDSKLEGRAKQRADDLHDAAKKLRDVFHDKKDKNNPDVRKEVDKTLSAGSDVNQVMRANRFTDKLQSDWDLLRADLNALAAVYNLSPLQ